MAKAAKKSMREKIDSAPNDLPKVEMDSRNRGMMLVAHPKNVEDEIKTIPKGKLTTPTLIREKLAKKYKADFTCPLSSGWFIRMAVEAAEEARAEGEKKITPWWRIVKEDGSLNPKFPGNGDFQKHLLEIEGFTLAQSAGTCKVQKYQEFLT